MELLAGCSKSRVSVERWQHAHYLRRDVRPHPQRDGVIEVKGVLLSLVGSGAESITATITNTGDVRLVSNETQVIRSVVDPLSDDEVSVSPITVIRHDGSIDENKTDDYFHLVITEAHLDSFTGARLELEFSGIPEGVVVNLDSWLTDKANFDLKSTDSDRTDSDGPGQ